MPSNDDELSYETAGPVASRRTGSFQGEQADSRRQQLMRVAAELFARKGVNRTSMRDIGQAVGMNAASLYHHFESKEALVDEILSDFWGEQVASYETAIREGINPADQISRLLNAVLRAIGRRSPEFVILSNDFHYLSTIERFRFLSDFTLKSSELWQGVIREGIESGDFRKDLDARIVYRTILGSALWVAQWYRPQGPLDVEEIARIQTEIFLSGLRVVGDES